ncbi:MAG: hypothetical protein ACI95C_000939 [Pseudohongiellaceae bacterium]|jgi:hypothetical protein
MPVNSISFNQYLGGVLGVFLAFSPAFAQLPALSSDELSWLGTQIYKNECNSSYQCLTSWNQGEDFPSLGIGHFIWYQQHQQEIFEETFPSLINHMQLRGANLPNWLAQLEPKTSPWPDRETFLADLDGPRLTELRAFLIAHQDLQAEFIASRLFRLLPTMLANTQAADQEKLRANFHDLAASWAPYGLYALIDYVHFKGTGIKASERYNNQGWGLSQVLLTMESGSGIEGFVVAADTILSRRVDNAPTARNEQRWLAGWKNRLQTYLPPA